MTLNRLPIRPLASGLAAALLLSACTVGPSYVRPTVVTPPAFKEAPNGTSGWVPTQPMDTIDRGAWWSVFSDPVLDGLERRVVISNQNVAQAVASYAQARALTSADRANFFLTATANASANRNGGGGGASANRFSASLGGSWAPDVWGRLRRQVQADVANAQASAADLANATLSAQTELAVDYFNLRVLDEQKRLLDDTVTGYQRVVTITQNQYNAGVAAKADLITAQTQLISAQASAADVAVQRAQDEHAIAVLAGMAPSELTIALVPTLERSVPTAPVVTPSVLLQRRPDIAAAERRVDAASAEIGVATAAYFPSFNLTADYGFNAASLGSLLSSSGNAWSIGLGAAETLLDFGARKARVAQARANYDRAVAAYRQTVLNAFRGVEDQLVALRVLEQESTLRDQALASARQAEQIALNRYRAGQGDFTTVVQAQNTALSSAQSVLSVLRSRRNASVGLIEALGGGWTTADLPKR